MTEKRIALTTISPMSSPQLLTSAIVYAYDRDRNSIKIRALLDTCATANFITESLVKRLNLSVVAHSLTIGTIDAMSTESKGIVRIVIQSTIDNFCKELTCLTIPAITELIPSEVFPRESVSIPSNIKLADPEFHLPRPVDLLIGSGATLSMFSIGQINLSREAHDLYLQKTRLGWVVAGSTSIRNVSKTTCHLMTLDEQLNKFWDIEEIDSCKPKSIEEIECETHFLNTVSRDNKGQYTVRLPFYKERDRPGNSRNVAIRRLLSLERKLNANATLKAEYTRVMEEYLKLGYMSEIETPSDNGFYMPHHAVIKEASKTTKLRIVFDASVKSDNGVSLNDTLMVGPTIQSKLFYHLIRFRTYKFVITADIERMYCQVLLHEEDRKYQRILWRRDDEIKTFQINTLTFGVSSSPYLAIRTVQKLADDEYHALPRASEIIKTHLYVHDLLTGADTVSEARAIRNEVISLLSQGGFIIRQWASNNKDIINDLNDSEVHTKFMVRLDDSLKTLGVTWDTQTDKIYYTTRPIKNTERLTKRSILSEIAKIFDPLGLLGPVILYAKKLMQNVWRCGVDWDESIPQSLHAEWYEFTRQLQFIDTIAVDRRLLIDGCENTQIHGFCDASSVGYGACLYIRSKGMNGNIVNRLLCAKSRVAPLKLVTIPRLELCGALVLAQLYRETIDSLNIVPNKVVFWCDSTIVLSWLRTSPHRLKTYVATRVAKIQEITGNHEWRHIKTTDNPADAISRGQLPDAFLRNKTWFNGPTWLRDNENEWPNEKPHAIEIPELKTNTCLTATTSNFEILEKYSSYSKLLRVVAYCCRFLITNKYVGSLCTEEINGAEMRILKLLQAVSFSDEIKKLKNKQLLVKSKLIALSPFLDENDLLRVGGRLCKSNLTASQKHQILIPSHHRLTDQIIREIHERHLHAGIQTTLHILRQRFWILDGRNRVRKIIRTCTRCYRFNANSVEYKMANLPSVRVCEAIPFANTGVDFCGPFFIKERKHRNRTRIKVYVCIFVCMVIKAVHLEVVSDLSSEGFLAAMRRFVARRGLPSHIYSDNGTNFVGANNQLKELYVLFNSDYHKNNIERFASEHRINWHFIPPLAPHFGGLWESTVKLFKHHFRRVVGDLLFTFEELNTFTIEVEGILNSRPITSLSSDPNDALILTPAHYLIGKPLTALPEGNLSSVPANRLSNWQHITKVRQDFWKRWNLEYLNELQKRHKWSKEGHGLEIDTIVLIKDKTLPCTQWLMGKVIELHPGEDGIARAATVKTATGKLKRATKLLCPLPVEQ